MKVLALDSTALVASVALCEDGKLLGELTLNNGNTHSQTLLPMVEFLLKQFDMTPGDVDLFAATVGPGSFTGVRIGAATLKGLAFGTNKPCAAVSTLEALAYNLKDFDGLICPVMNARRKQVYTALFRASNGHLTRLMDDSAIAIAELDEKLREFDEPVRLCGDGYDITEELLTHPIIPVSERYRHQSAFSAAEVALQKHQNGDVGTDLNLSPVYLRLSQAERERAERQAVDTGI
ncbi:MAG: tRNA (adenosine(37)-N6)-threonylcarbamoyltransferase complex dimerization subunit type 1 TsaB [Clostridia bacterium]|nr:tRNA (adenosine(37)-N6)-threonylcarbamoyltransferase complex dimerization subunit type 1 TsaB [Clostridia bacterium]